MGAKVEASVEGYRHGGPNRPAQPLSRPKNHPVLYYPEVIARILELRDNPPEQMARKMGSPTIRYFLHQDERLKVAGYRLPSFSSTIVKILNRYQRIQRPPARKHLPFERPPAVDM